jgi:hypothetical protein
MDAALSEPGYPCAGGIASLVLIRKGLTFQMPGFCQIGFCKLFENKHLRMRRAADFPLHVEPLAVDYGTP